MEFVGLRQDAIYGEFAADDEERGYGPRLHARQQRAQRGVTRRHAQIHVLYGQITHQKAA